MFSINDVIWGIIAPAVFAAIAMVLAHLPRRKSRDAQPWGAAAGIAGGFAIAFIGMFKLPAFSPMQAQGWFVWLAVPTLMTSIVATVLGRRRWIIGVLSLSSVGLSAWFLLHHGNRDIIAPVAMGMMIWWMAMELLSLRVRGATMPLLLTLWSMAVGVVLFNNCRTQTMAQLAGAAAGALVVITVLTLWLRNVSLAGGGMLALATFVLGLIVYGRFLLYTPMSQCDMILLAIAPLMAWAGELPGLGGRPKLRFAVRTLAFLIVLAIPLVPAMKGFLETLKEQNESYMYGSVSTLAKFGACSVARRRAFLYILRDGNLSIAVGVVASGV